MDNLKALDIIDRLTLEMLEKIDKILENRPAPWVCPIWLNYIGLLLTAAIGQSSYGRQKLDVMGRTSPMFV